MNVKTGKRIIAGIAVSVMGVVITLMGATPADAYAYCQPGQVCISEHRNFLGKVLRYYPNGACFSLVGTGLNNEASSIRNYSNQPIFFFDGDTCNFAGNWYFTVVAGKAVASLFKGSGNPGAGHNDDASSFL
jgi:hypothetical protein